MNKSSLKQALLFVAATENLYDAGLFPWCGIISASGLPIFGLSKSDMTILFPTPYFCDLSEIKKGVPISYFLF